MFGCLGFPTILLNGIKPAGNLISVFFLAILVVHPSKDLLDDFGTIYSFILLVYKEKEVVILVIRNNHIWIFHNILDQGHLTLDM